MVEKELNPPQPPLAIPRLKLVSKAVEKRFIALLTEYSRVSHKCRTSYPKDSRKIPESFPKATQKLHIRYIFWVYLLRYLSRYLLFSYKNLCVSLKSVYVALYLSDVSSYFSDVSSYFLDVSLVYLFVMYLILST